MKRMSSNLPSHLLETSLVLPLSRNRAVAALVFRRTIRISLTMLTAVMLLLKLKRYPITRPLTSDKSQNQTAPDSLSKAIAEASILSGALRCHRIKRLIGTGVRLVLAETLLLSITTKHPILATTMVWTRKSARSSVEMSTYQSKRYGSYLK